MNANPDDLHSRSRLAGYDPDTLANAHVLVVGCGAVGQNLLLDLALSGVGAIAVVDHDTFERHNATRSPFYPSPTELAVLGPNKATVAAHRLAALMTADNPEVRHRVATIQQVGDAAIAWADVVCSAVDNQRGRAYLAERCRYLGVALVEVGFEGSSLNLGVFGPAMCNACSAMRMTAPAGG